SIEFSGFGQRFLRIIGFGCFTHSRGIDDQQIAALIVLQKFNCSSHHIGQTWLIAPVLSGIGMSRLRFAKCSKELWSTPCWNTLQICAITNNVEAAASQFEQQIAVVLPATVLRFRKEFCRARAESNIDFAAFNKLLGQLFSVARVV